MSFLIVQILDISINSETLIRIHHSFQLELHDVMFINLGNELDFKSWAGMFSFHYLVNSVEKEMNHSLLTPVIGK